MQLEEERDRLQGAIDKLTEEYAASRLSWEQHEQQLKKVRRLLVPLDRACF